MVTASDRQLNRTCAPLNTSRSQCSCFTCQTRCKNHDSRLGWQARWDIGSSGISVDSTAVLHLEMLSRPKRKHFKRCKVSGSPSDEHLRSEHSARFWYWYQREYFGLIGRSSSWGFQRHSITRRRSTSPVFEIWLPAEISWGFSGDLKTASRSPPIQRLLIIRQIQLGIARYRVNKLVRQEPLQVKIKKRTWRIWGVGRKAGSSGLSPPSGNVFASPLTCGCCSRASGSSL